MNWIEELMQEMNIEPSKDKRCFYTGKSAVLCRIAVGVVLSEDKEIFNLSWEQKKKLIKEKFYETFPYMNAE